MAVKKILRAGNPLLRQKSQVVPITEIRSKEIKDLVKDMFDSMKAANGIGLAAPQIGILKRVIIVGYEPSPRYPDRKITKNDEIQYKAFVNPKVEILTDEIMGNWEGCLSVPNMRGYVERPTKIKLSYYDLSEEYHQEIVEGFDAVVVQHECDHLDGILYIDRLKDPKLFGFEEEFDKLERYPEVISS